MSEPVARRSAFDRHPRVAGAVLALLLVLTVDVTWGSFTTSGITGLPHPYFHHTMAANFSGRSTWQHGLRAWVHTNSLAMRDASTREVPLKTDRYRVLFLGDSFTEGVGVDFEDSFVGRVASGFSAVQVEVLNGGVVSLSPRLYRLKLEWLLERGLKVDEVAVFIDVSDPIDDLLYEDFVPREEFTWAEALGVALVRRSAVGRVLAEHLPMGPAFRTMQADSDDPRRSFLLRSRWSVAPEDFDPWGRAGLAKSVAEMDGLVELCRRHGVRVGITVYPWPSHIFTRVTDSPQRSTWRKFASDRGIAFTDLWPLFVDGSDPAAMLDDNFHPGDVHWNVRGHARVASQWMASRCAAAADAAALPCAARP